MTISPLVFKPIYKPKIWGGRRLAELLGRELPEKEPIGESWEVADLEDDQSVVAGGPARGKTLGELVKEWGTDLTGDAPLFDGRFPLLIKFLDAHDTLSVQVHPDEAMAAKLGGKVRVKNEAWYIVEAEDSGAIYRGVVPGVDALGLRSAIEEGRVESVLRRIPVRKGQCYYLPSGTLHALGAGVVVAEIQTPSDVTYRVFDWNRIDSQTGQPRDLHVAEAMQCVSFDTGLIAGEKPRHVASVWTAVTRLVGCDSFVIERVRMVEGIEQDVPSEQMVVWMILEGRGSIAYENAAGPLAFRAGDTVLLPAALAKGRVAIETPCMWLEVSVPSVGSPTGLTEEA